MTDLFNADYGAILSPDRTHRYSLWRILDHAKPKVLFVGLNPSTADEHHDDPTIRRCKKFAFDWGYGGFYFCNLYSFITADPKVLIENLDHAANWNTNSYFISNIKESEKVICCWGSWNFITDRKNAILKVIQYPYCLGINADGNPKHPLYLKASTIPELYNPNINLNKK